MRTLISPGKLRAGSGRFRIGFTLSSPEMTYWALLAQGAKERAHELAATLMVVPARSMAEQAVAVDQFVRDGVDAVVVAPNVRDDPHNARPAFVAALRRARHLGIPVISPSGLIGEVSCALVTDNAEGGRLAAAYLGDRLGRDARLAHLRWPGSVARGKGFRAGLAQCGGRVVYDGVGDWTREAGYALLRAALRQQPEITGVFAENDPLALGAADAIAEVGRSGEILVVGFDGVPEGLEAVVDGRLAATVSQDARRHGKLLVDLALDLIRGKPTPRSLLMDVTLVAKERSASLLQEMASLLPYVLHDLAELRERELRPRISQARWQAFDPALRLSERDQHRKTLVRRAIAFMVDNLDQPVDVAEVAAAVPISRSHLYDIFIEEAGKPPRAYLMDLRVERAKELLATSGMSVTQVATAVGYRSISYFSKVFREQTGFSPNEFARRAWAA